MLIPHDVIFEEIPEIRALSRRVVLKQKGTYRMGNHQATEVPTPVKAADALANVEDAFLSRYREGAREPQPELCCPINYNAQYLKLLPQELVDKDYGCGDPSQKVGPEGSVIGVYFNDDLLALTRKYQEEMREKLGYGNVSFKNRKIQDLTLDLEQAQQRLDRHPMWREAFLGMDWVKLRWSRVYYGIGVPKGDKSAVILVPGFLGYDYYMVELFTWLWRMRYRPYMSRIGHNAECPDILVDRLMKTVRRAYRKTGKRVHLVGHSLGGVISRGAAVLDPDLIASVTSLGSPLRGIRAHPHVLTLAERVRERILSRRHERPIDKPIHDKCFTNECTCGFMITWRDDFPDTIHETAIYTKTDGIVDWEVCRLDNPETDFEVRGTHCGLVWNPEVFSILANRLAEFDTTLLPKTKKTVLRNYIDRVDFASDSRVE